MLVDSVVPQVALEAFGGVLDFQLLSGLWRLLYTTASDVVRNPYFVRITDAPIVCD